MELLSHCPPPPGDLSNSLVGGGRSWTLLPSAWPSNGLGIDAVESLRHGRAAVSWEMAGRAVPGGRVGSVAASWSAGSEEVSLFASGRQILAVLDSSESDKEKKTTMFEVVTRYEVKTLDVVRAGPLVLVAGGPRGAVVQTCEAGTKVLASLWRQHAIRLVRFSPRGRFLLLCSMTGFVGLWKVAEEGPDGDNSNLLIADDAAPVWSCTIPSASMCCAAFSGEDRFCVSLWADAKGRQGDSCSRPMHYVFEIRQGGLGGDLGYNAVTVVPVPSLQFLCSESKTMRVPLRLPPPSLCEFSSCGKFLAATSSCSSLRVWEVATGHNKAKWKLDDREDEIVGLADCSSSKLGLYLVRTLKGKLVCLRWPSSQMDEEDSNERFWKQVLDIPTRDYFQPQSLVGSNEKGEKYCIVWAAKKAASPGGCKCWVLKREADDKANVVAEYESSQPPGHDRVHTGRGQWVPVKIKLTGVKFDQDDSSNVTLTFSSHFDNYCSTFHPKSDTWKLLLS